MSKGGRDQDPNHSGAYAFVISKVLMVVHVALFVVLVQTYKL